MYKILLFRKKRGKVHMFIQPVPCDSDAFSHGKGGYNGTNSKSFDMPETKSGEGSSDNQADYIEADLDFWICHRSDLGQFPWERSVGTIGILQRLEIAIPIQIKM